MLHRGAKYSIMLKHLPFRNPVPGTKNHKISIRNSKELQVKARRHQLFLFQLVVWQWMVICKTKSEKDIQRQSFLSLSVQLHIPLILLGTTWPQLQLPLCPSPCLLGTFCYFLRSANPHKDSRSFTEAALRLLGKMGYFQSVWLGSVRLSTKVIRSPAAQICRADAQIIVF